MANARMQTGKYDALIHVCLHLSLLFRIECSSVLFFVLRFPNDLFDQVVYAVISDRRWEMKLFYEPLFGFRYVCRVAETHQQLFSDWSIVDSDRARISNCFSRPAGNSVSYLQVIHDSILNNWHFLLDFEFNL